MNGPRTIVCPGSVMMCSEAAVRNRHVTFYTFTAVSEVKIW